MNFLQKKIWIAWSKLRFLRLPVEKRVRLEVTTDGRHITFLLVSLYEAGYGVQVVGSPAVFRELICLRKSAPIPFVIGGREMECGISITDRKEFSFQGSVFSQNSDRHSPLVTRNLSHILLDYDYFSGLATKGHESEVEELTTIEHWGRCEKEQPKVGLKAEGVGATESKSTEDTEVAAGQRLAGQAGAEFSNPFTSELAQDSENTSPTRTANGPAEEAIRAEMQRSGNIEPRMTRIYTDGPQGDAQETCAGDAFSNPSTSELARDAENTSPTRSASVPAGALLADHGEIGSARGNQPADSVEFLEGQSQAGLQMDNQKDPTIRTANDPTAPGEYSSPVLIRDIRGQNSSSPAASHSPLATALRAPYFMHPSFYHRGLHKNRSSDTELDTRHSPPVTRHSAEGASASHPLRATSYSPPRHRRFRIGFFGTHDREFYTKHYHFLGMNRFEILEVFLQKYGNRMTHLRGFPKDWEVCEIAVSIDARGGDRSGKAFLSQDHYFEALRECDFVLSPPGWCMPVSHNLIEAMFCGAIPITNGGAFMAEPLADGVNCLAFKNADELAIAVEKASAMDAGKVQQMRQAVQDYYGRFLEPKAFGELAMQSNSSRILVNAEEHSVPLLFPGKF